MINMFGIGWFLYWNSRRFSLRVVCKTALLHASRFGFLLYKKTRSTQILCKNQQLRKRGGCSSAELVSSFSPTSSKFLFDKHTEAKGHLEPRCNESDEYNKNSFTILRIMKCPNPQNRGSYAQLDVHDRKIWRNSSFFIPLTSLVCVTNFASLHKYEKIY